MARETIEIQGADLETFMDEIAARARERGLTESTLDELLAVAAAAEA